jgi:membrane-associated phospholipid phosphatase
MNLTDRIYVAVHVALTVLVCTRYDVEPRWPWYVAWHAAAIAAIFLLARKKSNGVVWEFAHDWLPTIFFVSVFEEVSFLSLALRGAWQNPTLITWETALFAVPPVEWLRRCSSRWFSELLEFGYASYYCFYLVVGGLLWAWRERPRFDGAFRNMTDALSAGYVVCYTTYLLFPTRSPSHNAGIETVATTSSGGPFHFLVRTIQGNAGVHGNAFPSAHIMLAVVVLVFAWRYLPRAAPWILVCVLLMCAGAVYDGYHYALDVIAGAGVGVFVGVAFLHERQSATPGR